MSARDKRAGKAAQTRIELASAYDAARGPATPHLVALLRRLADRDVVVVASGGALAVACFAADLHMALTGRFALVTTPLMFSGANLRGAHVLIVSAGAKHPDVNLVVESAIEGGSEGVSLVTYRKRAELPNVLRQTQLEVVELPAAGLRDGFLATRSVLALATTMASAYLGPHASKLPPALPQLSRALDTDLRSNVLILTGPLHASVGVDLETRLAETGLASSQVADYRNFAHGRHFGFHRNLDRVTVVGTIAPPFAELAEATLAMMPTSAQIARLGSTLDWPASVLDLLAGSMVTVVSAAEAAKVNTSRPGVPPFGRRLYRMSSLKYLNGKVDTPVLRKLRELPGRRSAALERCYVTSLERWLGELSQAKLGAVVLDYDGTVCRTEERFDLPIPEVRDEIERLLSNGLMVGFASGRGRSLARDLKKWVPRVSWDRVFLGLYSGAIRMRLSDSMPPRAETSQSLAELARRLRKRGKGLHFDERPYQLTISVDPESDLAQSAARLLTKEAVLTPPQLSIKVTASAHSVDAVASETSKVALVDDLERLTPGAVLAIGDQGQAGGNDFELLAGRPLTLSVDRCSTDPTRCWSVSPPGLRGPSALLYILKRLKVRNGTGRIRL